MVEPSNQSSLGARFRAAGWEEKPLQVASAINTYTARLAEASRPSIKWAVAYRLDHLLAGRPPPGCRPSLINPNRVWPRNT
jgi:hypothetical protein